MKVGVIGGGGMGLNHANCWDLVPGAALVGIVEIDSARRQELRKKGFLVFETIDEIIDEAEIFSICTPSHTHLSVILKLLKYPNIHFLVEKPVVTDSSQIKILEEFIKKDDNRNRLIGVGHIERFNPILKTIKNLLKEELPRTIHVRRVGGLKPGRKSGVIWELGLHDLDIMMHWFGKPLSHHSSMAISSLEGDKHDVSAITMLKWKFSNAILECSRLYDLPRRDYTLYFSDRIVHVNLIRDEITIEDGEKMQIQVHPRENVLKNELEIFHDCCMKGKKFPVSIDEGIEVCKLIIDLTYPC